MKRLLVHGLPRECKGLWAHVCMQCARRRKLGAAMSCLLPKARQPGASRAQMTAHQLPGGSVKPWPAPGPKSGDSPHTPTGGVLPATGASLRGTSSLSAHTPSRYSRGAPPLTSDPEKQASPSQAPIAPSLSPAGPDCLPCDGALIPTPGTSNHLTFQSFSSFI